MKEGIELEDVCLVAEVESEVIEQVRDGRITAIRIVSPKSKNEACIPAGLVLVQTLTLINQNEKENH